MGRKWVAAVDSTRPWGAPELHRRLAYPPPATTRRRPSSELRLPVRCAERSSQQSGHFFLNVDDDFRLAQFFPQLLILAQQLLVLITERAALGLGAAFLWRQGVQDACGALVPPCRQMRGVQALPAEQGADAARLIFGLIGLRQDALLVLARENAALRFGDDLGVWAADHRGRSGLAALGLTTALSGQVRRAGLRVLHPEYPSRPAL